MPAEDHLGRQFKKRKPGFGPITTVWPSMAGTAQEGDADADAGDDAGASGDMGDAGDGGAGSDL